MASASLSISFFFIFFFFLLFSRSALGGVHFSTLPQNLVVTASPEEGTVLVAGEDSITVTWGLNQTLAPAVDASYKKVRVKLCYAPISQHDRAWRKTQDDLSKDKTCQFQIVARPYSSKQESFDWKVERDVPTATFFIRAYAINSNGDEVAYGQTTDAHKATNLFQIQAISGRHVSLDIAAACFSIFSVVSLFGFFYVEKRRARISSSGR